MRAVGAQAPQRTRDRVRRLRDVPGVVVVVAAPVASAGALAAAVSPVVIANSLRDTRYRARPAVSGAGGRAESGRDRYGTADRDLGIRSAPSEQLHQVAAHTGERLRYTYDFGDDWEHDILIEDITEPEPDTAYPRCLAGRRACPPEDCGGIWGYDYLIEILADPHHEEHEDRLEWLGLDSADQFDPAAFDPTEVNTALSVHAAVLVKN
ncbi:plasmid pRiA4b ORF-3 family protein [Streptomyces sp. NPDC088124]|uniref:plasmid pRiA4b ORF-3 family protein n=1 Tax=Streptomyces sp. NPDC088124 TaxID=3154654 RepID=UPI003432161B